MRQQVDLLQDGFIAPRVVLPPRQAVAALAAVVVFMILLHALLAVQYQRVSTELASTERDVAAEQARLNEGQASPRSQKDKGVQAQLMRVRALLAQRQQMLKTLQYVDSRNDAAGFSPYLRSLASRPQKGLWLTRIHLRAGGQAVSLQGRTLAPEFVPRFLTDLQAEKVFRGQRFDALDLSLPDPRAADSMRFELHAHLDAEA